MWIYSLVVDTINLNRIKSLKRAKVVYEYRKAN